MIRQNILNYIHSFPHFGLYLAVLSGVLLVVSNALAQSIILGEDSEIPIFQIVIIRSAIQLPLASWAILAQGIHPYGGLRELPFLILTGICGTLDATSTYLAYHFIPLSDWTVVQMTRPIFMLLINAALRREKFSLIDLLCILSCACGLLIMVRPSFVFGELYQFWFHPNATYVVQKEGLATVGSKEYMFGICYGLFTSLIDACSALFMQWTGSNCDVMLTIFYPNAVSLTVLPFVMAATGKDFLTTLSLDTWLRFAWLSLTLFFSPLILAECLRRESASTTSLVRNCEVIYAMLFQMIFIDIVPLPTTIFGVVVVVIATALVAWRHQYDSHMTAH